MTKKQKDIINEYIIKDIKINISSNEFFNDITCRFSIDKGIDDLRNILSTIVKDSPDTEIYVVMYYDELTDNEGIRFWYSDMITINTNLTIKQISDYFNKNNVKPSDISIIDEDVLFVNDIGEVQQVNNKLRNLINLYWD